MAHGSNFTPDEELSELFTKLWELDTNKCYPYDDFEIDLQGYVTSGKSLQRDRAKDKLFSWVDEERIFQRRTYKAFIALLDNYELECGEAEVVTKEEWLENREFINAIMETEVLQEAHNFLAEKKLVPESENEFKTFLWNLWFKLVRRTRGDRDFDSSSFEHVFVGEGREDQFIGLHNWIQFYIQEKLGNIDYHGYFKRSTVKDDEFPRLIALQFSWKGEKAKPMSSCFLGTSPEWEIAIYTILYVLGKFDRLDCQVGEYEVELDCHPLKGRNCIGTAYVSAARM